MKIIILLLSVAFLGFSCSNDDDSSSSVSSVDVLGAWSLVSESEQGELLDLNDCELNSTVSFTETEFTEVDSDIFGLDGECFEFDRIYDYFFDGNELVVTEEYEGEIEGFFEGVVSVSGDELTIDDEGTFEGETFGSVRVFERITE